MSVVIRMKRSGRKNRPCYRISVADARKPRDGRTIESLGLYDPIAPRAEMQLNLDVERARYWLAKGAQPSETVASIFKRNGVIEPGTTPAKRARPGRKLATKTGAQRKSVRAARASAKTQRREARRAAAAAARKAAAEAEPSEAQPEQ